MRLIELYAEEFGCFTERHFRFDAGLNLIEGANESGKSTLQALLRFLLYGFPRRNSTDGEERDKRLSRKGRRAAGSLLFAVGDSTLRLRRDYILHHANGRDMVSENLAVTDTVTGKELSLDGKSPGEYFLKLPFELFQSSCLVLQTELDSVSSRTTGDAVSRQLFVGEGNARLEVAGRLLDQARRDLRHAKGNGGKIAEYEAELEKTELALAKATERAEQLRRLRDNKSRYALQVGDRAREIEQVERALAAARLDAELSRYDAWKKACSEEQAAREALDAAQQEGERPSVQFLREAAGKLQECNIAAEQSARLAAQLDAHAAELERCRPRGAIRAVAELGGAAVVEARAAQLKRRCRRLSLVLSLLLVLGGALGALGLLLPPHRYLLPAGVGCLALACLAFIPLRMVRLRRRAFYRSLQLTDPHMLRTLLQQSREEQAAFGAAKALYDSVAAQLTAAKSRESDALAALSAYFAAHGVAAHGESVQAAREYLLQLATAHTGAADRATEAKTRYARARSAAEALGAGIDPASEAALRQQRAALPLVSESVAALEQRLALAREAHRGLSEKLLAVEREEAAVAATATDREALLAQKAAQSTRVAEAKEYYAAVTLAQQALREASEGLFSDTVPRIAQRASALLRALTVGAHERLTIDEDFSVFLDTPEGVLPLSRFSTGCADATYLALRLALADEITEEPLPLLLDEVTAHLDNTRTGVLLQTLLALAGEGRQCLLFTCHTREGELLQGAPVHRIRL